MNSDNNVRLQNFINKLSEDKKSELLQERYARFQNFIDSLSVDEKSEFLNIMMSEKEAPSEILSYSQMLNVLRQKAQDIANYTDRLMLKELQDAAEIALNEIAHLCGCPDWDYPGQVVRDVEDLKKRHDELVEKLK
jgi:hypothetical protein